MKIPKKITPDRIRDSIVEVRFDCNTPFEALTGIFYNASKDFLEYSNRPLGMQQVPIAAPSQIHELKLSLGGVSLFYNENVKIQLQPNSIIFNCLEKYVGWEIYRKEIAKALFVFAKSAEIQSYSRIGMRYISEYPSLDLIDCVKFSFTFGMPGIKSETYSFRSEFKYEDYKVILNLNNKLPVVKELGSSVTPTSIVDIDVIEDNILEKETGKVQDKLDKLHSIEKEIFFNIIKEEFLQTLKPEY